MELKIEIDETRFKDVLENELKAFTKDEIHGIIHDAMKEYLLNDEILKKLFTETSSSYGYNTNRGNNLLQQAVDKINMTPVFEDIQKSIIDYVNSNNAVKEMAYRLFADTLTNGISQYILTNESFRAEMNNKIINNIHDLIPYR